MGSSMALKPTLPSAARAGLLLAACLVSLAGCAQIAKVMPGKAGGKAAAAQPVPPSQATRAMIAQAKQPVMRVKIPSRGLDALVTIRDRRGEYVNWFTDDGKLFTFRNGILIETRGLGADLMSSAAPSPGQIASGAGHRRSYFYVDAEDQTGRRDYSCVSSVQGGQQLTIYGRQHNVREVVETCERDVGRIRNKYWLEGGTIRKSLEWVSPGIGQVEFERVID